MRRLFTYATLCAAFLLLAGPAAAATSWAPLHASGHARSAGHGTHITYRTGIAPLRYIPLARTLSGTGTISLDVYQFDRTPEVNAEADWWVYEGDDVGTGYDYTNASGHVALPGVPAATSDNGEIAVYPSGAAVMYDMWNLSWPAEGTSMDIQPGKVPMLIYRSDDSFYNGWSSAWVTFLAEESGKYYLAGTDIAQSGYTTYADAATISLGPATLDEAAIHYWGNEGAELSVAGVPISPGTFPYSMTTDESDAHAVWMDGWASGKPGTVTWLVFERFPAGWTNSITAQAGYPASATVKSFGTFTSNGDKYQGKKLTIPSTVKPGYAYNFAVAHTDGPLDLSTWFQTCTLKASKASIRRGSAIKLSGVIPTKGHLGSTRGLTKSVIIYKTTKSTSTQPSSWSPKRTIWTKVATVRANGLGGFTSGSLRPTRTTRYVVRYPGDAWYWGAFTSLCKVTVR